MAASDLVQHSELETTILPNCVQHTFYRRGESAKNPRVKVVEQWVRLRHLGSGSFGTVWLERCTKPARPDTPQIRAVKEIKTSPNSSTDYYRELEAIAKFSHIRYIPCFVRSFGWYRTPDAVSITMEYLPYGDLQQYLLSSLAEEETRTISKQILDGLIHMHQNKFAHRDLKPQNILVVSPGPDWLVQITDFGISKRLQEDSSFRPTIGKGTLKFMAPEMLGIISEKRYPYAVDIWSLGVIAFLLLTNEFPFEDLDRLGQYARGDAEFGEGRLVGLNVSPLVVKFLSTLLSANPQSRPSALEACSHEWITMSSNSALDDANSNAEVCVLKQDISDATASSSDENEDLFQATASWDTHIQSIITPSQAIDQTPSHGLPTPSASRAVTNQNLLGDQRESSQNPSPVLDSRPADLSSMVDPNATASWSSPNATFMTRGGPKIAALAFRKTISDSSQNLHPPMEPVLSPKPSVPDGVGDTTPSPPLSVRRPSKGKALKVPSRNDTERDSSSSSRPEDCVSRKDGESEDRNKPLSGARLPMNAYQYPATSQYSPLHSPSKGIRDMFSRIVSRNRSAKPMPEVGWGKSQKPANYYEDPYMRKVVEPEEVQLLIRLCTEELKARALDLPFFLLPYRPASQPSALRTLVRHGVGGTSNSTLSYDSLQQELRLAEPLVIASVVKWCWSRLPGGVVGWDAYGLFEVGEQDCNMARDAFKTFMPLAVDNAAKSAIIFDFFDLLSAIAAHGKMNGMGGRKLSRMAGWWAFEQPGAGRGFDDGYEYWLSAAKATSHLFFAYLRSLGQENEWRSSLAIHTLPISLQRLLQDTEYPPQRPALMQSTASRVVMLVDTPSPTPLALIKRSSHFDYHDESRALQEWSEYEDQTQALSLECRRVLNAVSTTSSNLPTSSPGNESGWLDMVDFFSVGSSTDAEEQHTRTNRPPAGLGLDRPTTPSWADFLASGYADDGQKGLPNILLPPDHILPPIETRNYQKGKLEGSGAPTLGELASITEFQLDDAFWWVWMSSIGPEETSERKSVFGLTVLLETVIRAGRWIVLEEVVHDNAPDPAAGAYTLEKKSIFGWTKR